MLISNTSNTSYAKYIKSWQYTLLNNRKTFKKYALYIVILISFCCALLAITHYYYKQSPIERNVVKEFNSIPCITCLFSTPVDKLYVIFSSKSFLSMAINAICLSEIPASDWLLVAADVDSYNIAKAKGINSLLININTTDTSTSFGSLYHISINRAKISLIQRILEESQDLILIDADVIILDNINNLFNNELVSDLTVMYDAPQGLMPPDPINNPNCFSGALHGSQQDSVCQLLFEVNGGFLYIKSNRRTIALYNELSAWMSKHNNLNDQDALRYVLMEKFYSNSLAYYNSQHNYIPPNYVLSFSYFDPILAVNGGLFYFEGAQRWKALSKIRNIQQPIIIHINWVVGYERKLRIIEKHQRWIVDENYECSAITPQNSGKKASSSAKLKNNLLLVTSPKPLHSYFPSSALDLPEETLSFQKLLYFSQLFVLSNWLTLPHTQLLVYADEEEFRRLAQQFQFTIAADYKSQVNQDNLPFVKKLFSSAEIFAAEQENHMVMYSNSDLLYNSNLIETAAAIESYQFHQFLAVGRRSNLPAKAIDALLQRHDGKLKQIIQLLDIEQQDQPSNEERLQQLINQSAVIQELVDSLVASSVSYVSEALDYFIFSRKLWDYNEMPLFTIGRIGFDNWLLNWAIERRGMINVIDISATVSAVHINHNRNNRGEDSHSKGDVFNTIRLTGEKSINGYGRLEYCSYSSRTLKDRDKTIQIVLNRPLQSGMKQLLYDLAASAAILINHRPTLILSTVNYDYLPVAENWLIQMKELRGSLEGILLLTTGPIASDLAQQYNVAAFDLSNAQTASVEALNNAKTGQLQVISLRGKILSWLLEFGYDLLNLAIDEFWLIPPLHAIITRAIKPFELASYHTLNNRDYERNIELNESLHLLGSVDIIAVARDQSNPYNISLNSLYIFHRPSALHLFHRISAELSSLLETAAIPHLVDYSNINQDYLIQLELLNNPNINYYVSYVKIDKELILTKSYQQNLAGDFPAAQEAVNILKSKNGWKSRPKQVMKQLLTLNTAEDYAFSFEFTSIAASNQLCKVTASFNEFLSQFPNRNAVSVLTLNEDNLQSSFQWLHRVISLGLNDFLIFSTEQIYEKLMQLDKTQLINKEKRVFFTSQPFELMSALLLCRRMAVLLVNPSSVWFNNPLTILHNHYAAQQADNSKYFDSNCDLLVNSNDLPSEHTAVLYFPVSNSSIDLFYNTNQCLINQSILFSKRCLFNLIQSLRSSNVLSLCTLNAAYFPPAENSYEFSSAKSHFFPTILAGSYTNPSTGRMKSFDHNQLLHSLNEQLLPNALCHQSVLTLLINNIPAKQDIEHIINIAQAAQFEEETVNLLVLGGERTMSNIDWPHGIFKTIQSIADLHEVATNSVVMIINSLSPHWYNQVRATICTIPLTTQLYAISPTPAAGYHLIEPFYLSQSLHSTSHFSVIPAHQWQNLLSWTQEVSQQFLSCIERFFKQPLHELQTNPLLFLLQLYLISSGDYILYYNISASAQSSDWKNLPLLDLYNDRIELNSIVLRERKLFLSFCSV
jgi:hypothetical protein